MTAARVRANQTTMNRALVTGGAGFIGSNLVRLLVDRGYDVTVLDNLSTGYQENLAGLTDIKLIEGDIRDEKIVETAMRGVDAVFHLAATVGNIRSIEDPFEDSETNVIGTLRLLVAAQKTGVPKFVYSSSGAIFGDLRQLPIREDHPCEPLSPYGVSKLAAEKHCLAYSRLYGFEVVCLRYFNVYGNNQRYDSYGNVIPIFVDRMLRGEPLIVYGDGNQTRDFVNVADVAQANLLAARSVGVSGVFNIGCGEAVTINKLIELLREIIDGELMVTHAAARPGEVLHSCADISAARSALGFKPTTDFRQGLREYFEWARNLRAAVSCA